jgi:hypothetical protein
VTVAACAGLAAGVVPQAAAAGAPGATPGKQWIYFPLSDKLADPVESTVPAGTVSADGSCHPEFDGSGVGGKTDTANVVVEVALNLATCQAKLETGHLISSAATSGKQESESGSASGSLAPAGTADPTAYQDNKWLDRFNIQVNAQEQWVNWTDSGGCVATWNVNWKWSWLNDGWSKDFGNHYYGGDCSVCLCG